jgi:DNA-binding CsgD family transcriptional regulator/PAS domain-containing protein
MTLTETELFSRTVGLIYDAALDAAVWPVALAEIRDFVGGFAANFYWQDVSEQKAGIFHCIGIEQQYLSSYFTDYAKLNPIYPAAAFLDAGEIIDPDDIVPWSEMVQTRFYKEWMQPQGIIGSLFANLEKSATSVAALAVIRGEESGPVTPEARRRMSLVAPHMTRAASIGHLIGQTTQERAALTDTLDSLASAVFLVEPTARIVFANRPAEQMLSDGRLVRDASGILTLADPEANRIFGRALQAAGSDQPRFDTNGTAIVLNTEERQRWLAHVLPLTSGARHDSGLKHSAVAAVFLREASLSIPSPIENLSKSYKLTASETRILLAVTEIGSVPEIVSALGISESTVKTHLRRVFEKTGTRRQAELVKLIASFATSL